MAAGLPGEVIQEKKGSRQRPGALTVLPHSVSITDQAWRVCQEVDIRGPSRRLPPTMSLGQRALQEEAVLRGAVGGYVAACRILALPDIFQKPWRVLGAHRDSEQGRKEKLPHLFTERSLGKTHTRNSRIAPGIIEQGWWDNLEMWGCMCACVCVCICACVRPATDPGGSCVTCT